MARLYQWCSIIGAAWLMAAAASGASTEHPGPPAEATTPAPASSEAAKPLALESDSFPFRLEDLRPLKDALADAVGPEGKVIWLYDRRRVLIQDTAERFVLIRALLREFAPEVSPHDPSNPATTPSMGPMIRVELNFNEAQQQDERGLSVTGGFRSGPVQVGTPGVRGNRIRVDAIDRSTTFSNNQSSFLVVSSGGWSRMTIATEVARPVYFYEYLVGRGILAVERQFEWRQVGTSLEVAPTLRDGLIHLELTPVITSLENGELMAFRVRELSTQLTLAPGVRVHIGGLNAAGSDFNREFFSRGRRSSQSDTSFTVRADILDSGGMR